MRRLRGTYCLLRPVDRQWIWQATMRMEEPSVPFEKVVRKVIFFEFSHVRGRVRGVVVICELEEWVRECHLGGISVGLTVRHILSVLEGHERDGATMRRRLRDNLI